MGEVDPQAAARLVPRLAQVLQRTVDLVDRRPQPLEQVVAGVGQGNAARRAVQQAHAEALLELPHRVAERRGRDVEPGRRDPETEVLGDGDERGQFGEGSPVHC